MKPTVVFQTDFGAGGGGVLAGVVKGVDPEVPVYDFTHGIAAYDIRGAAYQLSTVVEYWPAGTIFVSVVDPGVGTARRACVARLANGSFVVTPDNGTLSLVTNLIAEVRQIDETVNRLPGSENVHIFNGRDVFAYTAARLAAGAISFEGVGPSYPLAEVVTLPLSLVTPELEEGCAQGGIYNLDLPYGSCRINIRNSDFQRVAGFSYGDHFRVRVTDGTRVVYEGVGIYERTFGLADESEAFLCGDIQRGAGQMLRLNVQENFVAHHAPELALDPARAAGYVVRFERI